MTNQQTTEALEPPTLFTIHWCPDCGRDDRIQSFKATHYSRGEICRGTPIELKYSRVSTPIAPDKAVKAAKDIVDRALAPHPRGMELLVNCAECGDILNAELCSSESGFSKQIFITVARCKCEVTEPADAACARAFPCRYQDARQCARDTMLGSECPKVCECACHAPASTVAPQEQKCEHGIPWSMECLSCGHSDYDPATRDEVPTFKTTKEAMLYAQRQGIPAVVPYTSPSTVARKAAEEIALRYIKPSVMSADSWDRAVDSVQAIIERCLSAEGADQKGSTK